MKKTFKLQQVLYVITIIIAIVILADFILPGKIYTNDVIKIQKEKQQYYNATQNHHYSYKITTSEHQFLVTKDFAIAIKDHKISYTVSLIFNEINRYKLQSSESNGIYSFRIVSGFVLPFIILITLAIAYKFKKKINLFITILQILLLANLMLLIL